MHPSCSLVLVIPPSRHPGRLARAPRRAGQRIALAPRATSPRWQVIGLLAHVPAAPTADRSSGTALRRIPLSSAVTAASWPSRGTASGAAAYGIGVGAASRRHRREGGLFGLSAHRDRHQNGNVLPASKAGRLGRARARLGVGGTGGDEDINVTVIAIDTGRPLCYIKIRNGERKKIQLY